MSAADSSSSPGTKREASAIVEAASDVPASENFQNEVGKGASALIDGHPVRVGRPSVTEFSAGPTTLCG